MKLLSLNILVLGQEVKPFISMIGDLSFQLQIKYSFLAFYS
jgi:hypothetical protein